MHRVGRRGLSGAVIEGILSVSADIVIVMDCDLQHKEKKISEMLHKLKKIPSLDEVIGTRFSSKGEISDKAFYTTRRLGSILLIFFVKKLLRIEVSDPLSGFFMVKREIF